MTSPTPAVPAVPRIFVSHSHHDNNFCRPFVAHLRSALGLGDDPDHIFYDESALHVGEAWLERIQREVISRPIFLVVLSPHSVVADYVKQETTLALRATITDHKRLIISVVIEPCDPNQVAPLLLNYQMADFVNRRYEVAFAELVEAIRGAGSGPAPLSASLAHGAPTSVPAASPAQPAQTERARALVAEAEEALRQGHWNDVLVKADFALTLPANHDNAALFGVLALAAAQLGQWERARDAARRVLDHDPFHADLWLALARAQTALGQLGEALVSLDRAQATTQPAQTDLRLAILGARRAVQERQEQWAAALATLDEELRLAPDDPARLGARLDLLLRLKRDADALAVARQLTARPDATAAQWLARARLAYDVVPDDDETGAALDAAARLAPTDPAIAQARRELPAIIPSERFPERLEGLGFVPRKLGGVEVIMPPLCLVPAGEFLMGSDPKRDRGAEDREKPQHRVSLPAYQIARFPVTVAEYACFVRAGGKEPQRGTYRPISWQDQLKQLDHPVVCMSWHDAMAYAAWLAKVTGEAWRLPTEAEWEKAARGSDGRIYPWGDAWDRTRANTSDGGPGTTTPVGTYPQGASPCGAQDMAGNVWEWTSSIFKPYPYNSGDGRERADSTKNRVLRGGSWDYRTQYACAAYRYLNDPGLFYVNFGVRLVRAVHDSP